MLSIIIPTYNEGKYLPKLLKSIEKQDMKDIEVIVADNNSKDNTKEIARKHMCKVIKGGLPPAARNNGGKATKGNLLLFLDADVVLPENFLRPALNEFRKRKLDAATCLFKLNNKKLIDNLILSSGNIMLFSVQYLDPHATGAFILCKKRMFDKINGFREDLKQAEDHDFVKRVNKAGKFGVLRKGIYISMRRFEKEGRMTVIKKYLKSEFYRKKEDIDYDLFSYEYGKY